MPHRIVRICLERLPARGRKRRVVQTTWEWQLGGSSSREFVGLDLKFELDRRRG